MSQQPDPSHEQLSRTLVKGTPIDPETLEVGTPAQGEIVVLEIDIDKAMLLTELEQAEVDIGSMPLHQFVGQDIRKYGQEAFNGYLELARAGYRAPKQKWFNLVREVPKDTKTEWYWVDTQEVLDKGDMISIRGTAIRA